MAHQFPFIDTDHSQAANTIANLRADYAQFGVDSSVNLNLAGVGTFSNTVSFGATVNVTGTLVDDGAQVGAAGSILSSTGSGIRWVPAGEGNTASASNVGTNANATAAEQWVAFLGSNSGNNPVRVDDDLRYNPSTNILTTGGVDLGNNRELRFGDDQALIIKHFNPGHSYIQQGAGKGDLVISTAKLRIVNAADDEDLAIFTEGLSAHLYFAGTERIRTADGGVVVTGICTATTFSGALTGDVTGNTSGSSGSCTGNAATATALQNARTIGGTSFDGTANINPGVAEGLTGTPSIDVTNIDIAGTLTDKNDAVGTSGQILTSTEDGVAWASVGDQADKVKVAAEADDTTCFPVFALTATGSNIELKSNTALKFNSDTGELEASKFAISSGTSNQFLKGDGSVDTSTYLSSIADEAITLAKIQHIDTSRILGRTTASTGDVEVLTKANVLTILNVADGAEVNVQSDWNASSGDAHILNKPTLVTAFTGLTDTPANYTSQASKFVKVNAAGDALEFGDDNNTNTFTGLTDTPGSFTASKFVKVNSAGNALEFVNDPNTNTTYDLTVEQTGDPATDANPVLRLGDGTTNDDITITGGTNVFVNRTSGTELTISSVNTTYAVVSSSANGLAPQIPNAHGGKFLKADATWAVPPDTTYGTVSTSAAGLAPTLPDPHGGKFLKGDATWAVPPDTTYGLVSTSANGLAPSLPATHGDKFLKADGSWEVPAYTTNTNTTYTLPAGGTNGTNYTDAKGSATIVLTDNAGTPNTDTVTITAGTNIKIDNTGVGGFTINAQDTTTNNLYKLECSQTGSPLGNPDPKLSLKTNGGSGSSYTEIDSIQIVGGTNCTVTRVADGSLTISSTDTNTFTGLTDTPANYTGHGSKLVAVNSSANGLEYVAAGSGVDVDTFLELTDTPGSFTASKFVKVNAAGNALEFGDDNNTTYGLFTTSANGLAPSLPAAHGGKFLKADGSWAVPAYNTSLADKIVEGNTSVEVVDSGTNGHIILTTEGAEAVRVDKDGFMGIGIQDPMDILHLHKGGDGVTNVGMILTHSTSGNSSSSDDGIHMYLSGTAASIDNFEGGGVTIRPDGATNGNVSITTSGTTFQSSVTASSLVKSGGTAAQFLKANGTVDSSTYSTTSHTHSNQAPLTFSTGITNTSNTVTVDSAVTTSVTWTASAGSIHNIDSIAVGSCSAIEYTIFVSNGSNIQSQKVLIMDNGTTAYIQEYAVMSNPNLIVTFTADVSSGNVRLRATPETGISGSTTTKFTKILIV